MHLIGLCDNYRQWAMAAHESDFVPTMQPSSDASGHRYVHVVGSSVWVHESCADTQWTTHFLGMHGDTACWGVDVPHGQDPADGAAVDLRTFFGRATETEWVVAGRAVQLVEWGRTHKFCGRCATPTQIADHERAYTCPTCRLMSFPRLAPAVITLVTRGQGDDEEALLARGVQWQIPMYSCLAGFVEPGENLEQAVAREILEEVGIWVADVQYVASQPWPFPHSLMLGFRARYDHGDIVCDATEIMDANWYRRDALPMIPPGISIARRLIDDWVAS